MHLKIAAVHVGAARLGVPIAINSAKASSYALLVAGDLHTVSAYQSKIAVMCGGGRIPKRRCLLAEPTIGCQRVAALR